MTRTEKAIAWTSLWVARLTMTVLSFTGLMHLLAGIDDLIRYPVAAVAVALLLKETL